MTALAPIMLFGLILASAPIIIHLLNRRRFIRVDWAPMEYLKLTLKANRRRLRLEQILLLVVRTLMVVALFLALARFVAQRDSLAGFLTARARTTRVLVIDDSLSMSHRSGGESALDRAKDAATRILKATGAKDSLTVMTVSRPESPVLRQAQLQENNDLSSSIQSIEPTHVANNWKATFEEVSRNLETALFPIKEVVIVTDLKSEGWSGELTEITDRWAAEGVKVFIVNVGVEARGNLALTGLEATGSIALVGDKIGFLATVRNDGDETLPSPQATLNVDGAARTLSLPDLPVGESVEVPLSLAFDMPGEHRVEMMLPTDSLPGDNQRFVVVEVKESLELLLVDGEPGRRSFDGETDFLALALSVGRSPWHVTQVTDSEWLNAPLSAPDVLVLANVASVPAARAGELEEMVASGMGLMIFPGELTDALGWNEHLYRGGQGLIPASLGAVMDQEVKGLVLEPTAASGLGHLARLSAASLARIQPRRLVTVTPPSEESGPVRVLARWNDAQNSPALLEKSFGRGKVHFWTVTADKGWSDWPTEASYVLAMRQSVESLAGGGKEGVNLIAGQPLRQAVDPKSTQATVYGPGMIEATPVAPDQGSGLQYPETRFAGFYELTWKDPVVGERARRFGVSPDPRESRLEPLGRERLEALMGRVDWQLIPFNGESQALGAQGAELWRSLVMALMALIAVESLLAAWVGRPK